MSPLPLTPCRLYFQRLDPSRDAGLTASEALTAATRLRVRVLQEECPPDVRRAALTAVMFPAGRSAAADEEDRGGVCGGGGGLFG